MTQTFFNEASTVLCTSFYIFLQYTTYYQMYVRDLFVQ